MDHVVDDDDVCGPTSSTNIMIVVYIFWEWEENQNVSPVPNVVDLFVIYVYIYIICPDICDVVAHFVVVVFFVK